MEIKHHMPHAYARRLAGKIAGYLRERYGARRVILLGSLATGFFNPDFSDINVGFEGLKRGTEEDAIADCRFHFGSRDEDGIRRISIFNLASLPPTQRTLLSGSGEEI